MINDSKKIFMISIFGTVSILLIWQGFSFIYEKPPVSDISQFPMDLEHKGLKIPDVSYSVKSNGKIINKKNEKVRMIHFWATWCPPCRKELPDYVEFLKSTKIKHILMSSDKGKTIDDIELFFKEENIDIKGIDNVLDDKKLFSTHFKITSYPTTVFLNENGEEVGRIVGKFDWSRYGKDIMKTLGIKF
jgi:thiol-disulfide isomerase/thioredoxin